MEKLQVFSYVSFINHKGVFLVGLAGAVGFTAGWLLSALSIISIYGIQKRAKTIAQTATF